MASPKYSSRSFDSRNPFFSLERELWRVASLYSARLEGAKPAMVLTAITNFLSSLEESEKCYLRLLNEGWVPQQARSILPNSLKTELVMTGTLEQWKGFFKLRSPLYGAIGAHPQAAELADKLYIQFKEKNYI